MLGLGHVARFASFLVLLLSAAFVFSQTADVNGVVRDPGQLVVAGAQVSLDGGAVHEVATTDGTGHYSLSTPAAGTYTLTEIGRASCRERV